MRPELEPRCDTHGPKKIIVVDGQELYACLHCAAARYGARIQALRKQVGISQAALARAAGVRREKIGLIETGAYDWDRATGPDELLLILKCLNEGKEQ